MRFNPKCTLFQYDFTIGFAITFGVLQPDWTFALRNEFQAK